MSNTEEKLEDRLGDPRTIYLDEFISHPPERVWRALTTPEIMARWLMPTEDFELEVGRRFTFRGEPRAAVKFDGVVYCEILDFEVGRMLSYSWKGSGENRLDSTVTWSLVPEGRGTRLFLEHGGFEPDDPLQQLSRRMMGGGWRPAMQRLSAALSDEEKDVTT